MFSYPNKIYRHNGQRRREKKTTNDQYELYCKYIDSHREILCKRMSDVTVQPLWDELTYLLNKLNGPARDKRAWQRTFENWRNVTRFKCRKEGINDLSDDIDKLRENTKLKELEIRALILWNTNAFENTKAKMSYSDDNESSFDGNNSDTTKAEPIVSIPVIMGETILSQNMIPQKSDVKHQSMQLSSSQERGQDPLQSMIKNENEIEIIDNYSVNMPRDFFPDVQNMGAQTQTDDTTLIDIGISIRNELKRLADAKIASLHEVRKQTDALNNMAEALKLLVNKNS